MGRTPHTHGSIVKSCIGQTHAVHLNILAIFPSNSGVAISGAVSGKITGIWNKNRKLNRSGNVTGNRNRNGSKMRYAIGIDYMQHTIV